MFQLKRNTKKGEKGDYTTKEITEEKHKDNLKAKYDTERDKNCLTPNIVQVEGER